MPTLIVIWIAKLAAWLTRATGRGTATALPGLVAEKLQPKILERLGARLKQGSILITGTNGKTTTTRMVAAALGEDHGKILVNRGGSNLTRGLVSSLIDACDLLGKLKVDRAIFEVDEAAFPIAVTALKPRAVMVLNLFRDQLDRYGELNTLATKIHQSLKLTDAKVVLNADDPLVAWLGKGLANVSYFGIDQSVVTKLAHDFAADSSRCPECGRPLEYQNNYYAHIGIYCCEGCSWARPEPDVVGNATDVTLEGGVVAISIGSKKASLKLKLPGLYNLYNGLAATTMANLETDLDVSIKQIEAMPAAYGRAEIVEIDGRKLQLLLVKNPTGFNQVIQAYQRGDEALPMLVVINDLIADGRDVSWLWDVAIEDLTKRRAFMSAGTRVYDMALRFKYADIKADLSVNLDSALDQFVAQLPSGGTGLILPTYTAMLQLRRALSRRTKLQEMDL